MDSQTNGGGHGDEEALEGPLPNPRPPDSSAGHDEALQLQPPEPPLASFDISTMGALNAGGDGGEGTAVGAAGAGGVPTAQALPDLGPGRTGGTGKLNKRMPRDPVSNRRICWEYARGACPRPVGTCRYAHVIPPSLASCYVTAEPHRPQRRGPAAVAVPALDDDLHALSR